MYTDAYLEFNFLENMLQGSFSFNILPELNISTPPISLLIFSQYLIALVKP